MKICLECRRRGKRLFICFVVVVVVVVVVVYKGFCCLFIQENGS